MVETTQFSMNINIYGEHFAMRDWRWCAREFSTKYELLTKVVCNGTASGLSTVFKISLNNLVSVAGFLAFAQPPSVSMIFSADVLHSPWTDGAISNMEMNIQTKKKEKQKRFMNMKIFRNTK